MRVENGLLPAIVIADDAKMEQGFSIENRLRYHKVSAVSIAVIHGGALEWAKAYGIIDTAGHPANLRTLFQAASISKSVTALAALAMVEDGRLSLNDDVESYLKSWRIPDNTFAISEKVTLARLLSHCAGLPSGGYDGYETGEQVPTLLQILNGQEPSTSPAVILIAEPGSKCVYGGAAYSITQQLIIDVTNKDFNSVIQETVFDPLGMRDSYYKQPLSGLLTNNAAAGYHEDLTVYEGCYRTYPELAAAGLWTTPTDLALFLTDILATIKGTSENVISRDMATDMVMPRQGNYGLGFVVVEKDGHTLIGHSGMNRGFRSKMVAYIESGDGVVVMANSENGDRIISELVRAVSREYGWTDYKPEVRKVVSLDEKTLASMAGKYVYDDFIHYELTLIDGRLFYKFRFDSYQLLHAESPSEFFTLDGVKIMILRDGQGAVSGIEASNYRGNFLATRLQ